VEHLEGLVAELRDHRQAVRMNWAMANPDQLKDERLRLDALLDTPAGEEPEAGAAADDHAARRAAADALLASLPSLEERPWRSN
jgi:hypothetical protein